MVGGNRLRDASAGDTAHRAAKAGPHGGNVIPNGCEQTQDRQRDKRHEERVFHHVLAFFALPELDRLPHAETLQFTSALEERFFTKAGVPFRCGLKLCSCQR